MYIVAIAWLYVTLLMALTEPSFIGGVLTFLFYGLLPCARLLWLVGTPQRKRNKALAETAEPPAPAEEPTKPTHRRSLICPACGARAGIRLQLDKHVKTKHPNQYEAIMAQFQEI